MVVSSFSVFPGKGKKERSYLPLLTSVFPRGWISVTFSWRYSVLFCFQQENCSHDYCSALQPKVAQDAKFGLWLLPQDLPLRELLVAVNKSLKVSSYLIKQWAGHGRISSPMSSCSSPCCGQSPTTRECFSLLYALDFLLSVYTILVACGLYTQGYPAPSLPVTFLSVRSTWWKNTQGTAERMLFNSSNSSSGSSDEPHGLIWRPPWACT